ncbi:hypothetical protein K457DRAFT_1822244 [Linnemannia elongata AG-77]|uniref:Uncharacterized protein n=1 Tax=Linnemannia elongata AG-77 TaxID=1314771 RepID=A0A197JM27_9FUNG|nr:hypothetical protein K457DRAFT_1822244 [Linnemannia elongata AG-77]
MLQEAIPQEQIQALRSVDKSVHPNSVPLATPDEIYHVETQVDPDTQKDIVLWDDILQAFKDAVQVRHKTKVVPFLKGKDFRINRISGNSPKDRNSSNPTARSATTATTNL